MADAAAMCAYLVGGRLAIDVRRLAVNAHLAPMDGLGGHDRASYMR